MRRPPRSSRHLPARARPPARSEVGGAPFVLPSWLDAVSERWWGLTPRRRALAVLVTVAAIALASAARVAASPYGPPIPVLVATADLPAGTVLDADDLRTARWPGELAPAGARTAPTGTLTSSLPAGAVLTEQHVTDRGVAGLVDPGRAAVPLPAELLPELDVGTTLQLVASAADGTGMVLADGAEVVAHQGPTLWLAVPADAAADVAAAGLRGSLAVAVTPATGLADATLPAPAPAPGR